MNEINYGSISSILSYFNANAYAPEQLKEDLEQMNLEHLNSIQEKMIQLLKEKRLGLDEFRRVTACVAANERAAHKFFEDVYKYAFEDGEEPDLEDYRRPRPKPAF